ncbi:MAG TPA: glycoside hydrolase family 28 protein [Gemmatimonadaceae bacterium]|nr:glycoside hydrolase family 28 protein [Gemmatimonadaceae bacterium]
MMQRRDFVKTLGAGVVLASSLGELACRIGAGGASPTPERGGWDLVPGILARIVPPKFPDREFYITKYGAVEGGTVDGTNAIRRAIAACAQAGGGRVVVPAGRFLTGAIHLESNVDLHVARGATLLFIRDPNAYLPAVLTRFESTELMNYSPFIYAYGKENVAITGEGTLDGQADETHWWFWKGSKESGWKPGMPNYKTARQRLLAMAEQGVPVEQRVFGGGDYLRPNFIQPYRCKNVLIENVSIVNSPMWEINPTLCENVTVRGVKINSHGPNNDGVDPDSCRDVLIEQCTFNTGDDCIAIKSGRNADGRRVHVPSENIIVRNCDMKDGHGGVTVGSEISGGCWNVFAHDCHMDSPILYSALRLKNNAMRGGDLHDIYMRDVTVGQVSQAILSIDFYYEEGDKGPFKPIARNIQMERVKSAKSPYALYLRGFPNAPIEDVRVRHCDFDDVANGSVTENVKGLDLAGTTINGKAAQ